MSGVADTPAAAQGFYERLKNGAEAVERRYRELTPRSAHLAREARRVLPGGSTRHGVVRAPYPLYVESAQGSTLIDVDGRTLVDFCFNATSLPLGHGHPAVMAAVREQLTKGTAVFAPTAIEMELAAEIGSRIPSAERVIFANSGGEAVMTAIRIARAFTCRIAVAKFEGSYHGSHDDVLWSVAPSSEMAGPATAPRVVPVSAGVPPNDGRLLILPYNDVESTVALIDEHASRLAAVIVEPLAYRMGMVLPTPSFLAALREACSRHGIVLIFDEVLSLRVDFGGMQSRLGVTPDLTTLGKVIGGGFPVGGVAGLAHIMAVVEPQHAARVYHTGTFAANPVTLTAGKATLDVLTPEVFDELNRRGEWLRTELRAVCRGLPLQITGEGSLFKISATPHRLENYRATLTIDTRWQDAASMALLNAGFFITPQLSGCIATATTDAELQAWLAAVDDLVRTS